MGSWCICNFIVDIWGSPLAFIQPLYETTKEHQNLLRNHNGIRVRSSGFMNLPLYPSYINIRYPDSITDLKINGLLSSRLFVSSPNFQVTNKITTDRIMLPASVPISLISARPLKRIFSQSCCAHVSIAHHDITNPIQLTTPTAPVDPPFNQPTYVVSPQTVISFECVIYIQNKTKTIQSKTKTNIFYFLLYIQEKWQVQTEYFSYKKRLWSLDEPIHVAKYSNMRKTKSAQPDHDTDCIKSSQLYVF